MDILTARPCLLTIAGFDPSSGAGISADMAVFAAHGCFGVAAITSMTVQSTLGVQRVQPADPGLLAETLACLEEDLPPAGIKIGMLADRPQVQAVVQYLQRVARQGRKPHVVLDPVLRSTSGADLLTASGLELMQNELLYFVDLITPNTAELSLLTDLPCDTAEQVQEAAAALALRYSGLSVLATGGDRPEPDDVLLHTGAITTFKGTRVATSATHGTGCALSSALLCGLVKGKCLEEAVAAAKHYVEMAMRLAEPRGSGKGPMYLLWPLLEQHRE